MLKIKKGNDLGKIRKKYGFQKEDGFYMSPSIDRHGVVRINCSDCYYSDEVNGKLDDLFDLIQAGVVEKFDDE